MRIPPEIAEIKRKLAQGQRCDSVPVWTFIRWFKSERRGYQVVGRIRDVLSSQGLQTKPDFDSVSFSSEITFALSSSEGGIYDVDPTIRLRRLEQTEKAVKCCAPMDELSKVVPMMMMDDYGQIPVVTGPRDVKGVVSWESIAQAWALGKDPRCAKDAMREAREISIDAALSETIPIVTESGYVLVIGSDRTIAGILTTADLNQILSQLSSAFLGIGEIEGYLRRLIRGKFTQKELKEASLGQDSEIEGPQDLTLGELIRLIESDANWGRLNLPIDKSDFIERLHVIRELRNDVMHFDPQGVDEAKEGVLRKLIVLLREMMR